MLKKIGVLALQGGVREHLQSLTKIENVSTLKIKKANELKYLDGLIIPGGESTTIKKLLHKYKFIEPIKRMAEKGKGIWGTCAGLILIAKNIEGEPDNHLNLLDIKVKRNAFGSQLNSFITKKIIPDISSEPLEMVFIRAPIITDYGKDINILGRVNNKVIAARRDNIFVTSFHPELTGNLETHKYFINKVCK